MKHRVFSFGVIVFIVAFSARFTYSQITHSYVYSELTNLEKNSTVIPAYSAAWGFGLSRPDQGSNIMEAIESIESGDYTFSEHISGPVLPQTTHPIGNSVVGMLSHLLFRVPVTTGLLVFGVLLGSFSSLLCYSLFKMIHGKNTGLVAGLVYALFPPCLGMSTDLSLLGSATFFVILATWAFLKACKPNKISIKYLILSGASLGFLAYFRSDWMLIASVFFLAMIIARRPWKIVFTVIGLLILLQLALMVPLALRSKRISGNYRVTPSTVGWVLLNGLGQYPNPWGIDGTDGARSREAEDAGYDSPSSPEANDMFINRFKDSVVSNPTAYMKILARRLVFLATPYQWGIEDIGSFSDSSSFVYRRSQAGLLGSINIAIQERWPQLVSAILMLVGLVGIVAQFVYQKDNKFQITTVSLIFAYGYFVHFFTRMTARYLFPGSFVQIGGLAFLVCFLLKCIKHRNTSQLPINDKVVEEK